MDIIGWKLAKELENPVGYTSWRTKQVYTLKQASAGYIITEHINHMDKPVIDREPM